ncbi:hypothetical protein CDL12_29370 [Handroanthus impetiginosus]|uniref:Uncharacterized protein n=1 Tax=Handroanthus impetiginosus TaxID=429701 RepID=A0A2G9FYY7_9LAMI|nr:hypothetical protein CDL12_29370 [Handroanthus impetiginosus]
MRIYWKHVSGDNINWIIKKLDLEIKGKCIQVTDYLTNIQNKPKQMLSKRSNGSTLNTLVNKYHHNDPIVHANVSSHFTRKCHHKQGT